MKRWKKTLLISLPAALLLTAALRFIHHTDQDYSFWIPVYEASTVRLEARCAAQKTSAICARARKRRAFAVRLESYRNSITSWWWPTVIAMVLAWIAVSISLFTAARKALARASDHAGQDQNE